MTDLSEQFRKQIESFTATQILAIPDDAPERLYLRADPAEIKQAFRWLARKWHPQYNTSAEAASVFNRVKRLRTSAEDKLSNGAWEVPGLLNLTASDGASYQLKYHTRHDFELGHMYISNRLVTYLIDVGYQDLFDNGVRKIDGLRFPNDEMKTKIRPLFPEIAKKFSTPTHHVLVVKKPENAIAASDLLAHGAGKLPPAHVAWMVSRLHNIGCYLQWAKLAHNGLTLDNLFIDPADHSVRVLGGWWYAAEINRPLSGLSAQAVAVASRSFLDQGVASHDLDRRMLRAAGCELLGDRQGVRLVKDKDIPQAFRDWLCTPGTNDAFEDYRIWTDKVLAESFGPRRFQVFGVTAKDVYHPS